MIKLDPAIMMLVVVALIIIGIATIAKFLFSIHWVSAVAIGGILFIFVWLMTTDT